VIASLYDWLVFFHVLAAMTWLGGLVVLTAVGAFVVRGGDSREVARFGDTLRAIGPIVLAPGPIAVLAFGIWLVVDSPAWDWGQTWIWLALVLFGAALAVGAGHRARAAIQLRKAAEEGRDADAIRHLRRWLWGQVALVVPLVVATWDMVFKPGL
jgi:uncharacterized membrane protein